MRPRRRSPRRAGILPLWPFLFVLSQWKQVRLRGCCPWGLETASPDPGELGHPSPDRGDEGGPRRGAGFAPVSPIFGRRKRRSRTDAQASQLRDWRSSAQRVNRAWNAWLAADGAERTCATAPTSPPLTPRRVPPRRSSGCSSSADCARLTPHSNVGPDERADPRHDRRSGGREAAFIGRNPREICAARRAGRPYSRGDRRGRVPDAPGPRGAPRGRLNWLWFAPARTAIRCCGPSRRSSRTR